jgi:hypothetical protein
MGVAEEAGCMSIYDSLPSYREIKISTGTVRVRKLALGELLEFEGHVRAAGVYRIAGNDQLELECLTAACEAVCGTHGNGADEDVRKIVEEAKDFNRAVPRGSSATLGDRDATKLLEQSKSDPDGDWLQKLLALLMRELGYSKRDVLELYPAEIPVILAENRKLKRLDEINGGFWMQAARFAPKACEAEMRRLYPKGMTRGGMSRSEYDKLKELEKGLSRSSTSMSSRDFSHRASRSATGGDK